MVKAAKNESQLHIWQEKPEAYTASQHASSTATKDYYIRFIPYFYMATSCYNTAESCYLSHHKIENLHNELLT